MRTIAVIGKSFGDEGKGLAVDYFSSRAQKPAMVVRHNGGAQSGHTVETRENGGQRFVFHALSSGSFRGADTLWINGFYPDLYKLGDEIADFRTGFGAAPRIFAEDSVCVTTVDDVLINMALETSRGPQRHGSCGMGINECDLRTKAGFGLSLKAMRQSGSGVFPLLRRLRESYTYRRLRELKPFLNEDAAEYLRLLYDDNVLLNAADAMEEGLKNVTLLSEKALKNLLNGTETLIFESGQGLLLDCMNKEYAPHVTASRTGSHNPLAFLSRMGAELDEAVYVSRTYVTRHGAGKLFGECPKENLGGIGRDLTNEPNEWQGQLRYAPHEDEAAFAEAVRNDGSETNAKISLFLTHLNETKNSVVMANRIVPADEFIKHPIIRDTFDSFYLSPSRFSADVKKIS